MDYHQNARLTIHSREQLALAVVVDGHTLKATATRFHVSAKTAAKWVRRYREGGVAALISRERAGTIALDRCGFQKVACRVGVLGEVAGKTLCVVFTTQFSDNKMAPYNFWGMTSVLRSVIFCCIHK